MIAVTGASGQLGRIVIEELLKREDAANIVAIVRDPAAMAEFAARGVVIRQADYDKPDSLVKAMAGVSKILLISSSAVGVRTAQHKAVIDAARMAGVQLLVYTSILKADRNPMILAAEHAQTEQLIRDSGLPFTFLRNSWYAENLASSVDLALTAGFIAGNQAKGRQSPAFRRDFAEAAAIILSDAPNMHAGKVYELAGDTGFSLPDVAAAIAKNTGNPVTWTGLTLDDHIAALKTAGLPEGFASALADADFYMKDGWLSDDSLTLSGLIGRPTASIDTIVSGLIADRQAAA